MQFNAYNEGELGVCGFNSAGDCLMDAANAIGEPNTVNLLSENLKDVIKQKSYEEILNNFIKRFEQSIVYRSNSYLLNELLQDWLYIIQHYIHDFAWQNEEK